MNDKIMIEKEVKVLLSKEEYSLLLGQFDWDEVRTQINHYYTDKENGRKNKAITIRVRECNNKAVLQIKVPMQEQESEEEQAALHLSKEFEAELNSIPKEIDGTFLRELCSIPFPDVRKAGSLTTIRHICNWDDNTELCLDKNNYLNVEDYELEIEYKKDIDPAIIDILKKNKITFHSKTAGKCKRFFNQLKNCK